MMKPSFPISVRALLLVAASALMASCASQSVVLPSAANLPDADVAILKVDRTMNTGGLRPELNNVYDLKNGANVLPSKGFHDYYKIRVAPGDYAVGLKIYSATHHPSFPRVNVRARAGMTYLFTGSVVMNGKATNAEFRAVPTAEDKTPE